MGICSTEKNGGCRPLRFRCGQHRNGDSRDPGETGEGLTPVFPGGCGPTAAPYANADAA